MTGIIDRLVESGATTVSVIGLAKNTGKTVTLNTLASEARAAGLTTAFVSFGRDGEVVDAITRLDKPRIHVFPGSLFVTAEGFINPAAVDVVAESGTGIRTVFGEVKIYTGGPSGGRVELIGINRVSTLTAVLAMVRPKADLVLIDGALDRRSSAVPVFSDACVLATGAVLGKTEESVVHHTEDALARLRLPGVDDPALRAGAEELYGGDTGGIVLAGGEVRTLQDAVAGFVENPGAVALVLRGALTDKTVEPLMHQRRSREATLVVKDATRVFLSGRAMLRLSKRNIQISVLNSVNVVALTVNPTRPYGPTMDSARLVSALTDKYPELICCDVMAGSQDG